MSAATSDPYTIISADCHAGGHHAQYREYLDSAYQDQFDAWRGKYKNPFRDLQDDGRSRNWDNDRRNGDLDAEGVAAEVVFPNTVPPFFPTGVVIAPAPTPEEFPLRLAHPGPQPLAGRLRRGTRSVGQAQIFLNDVDGAIRTSGARHINGVLLPGISPRHAVDRAAVVARLPAVGGVPELDMPLTHHAGSGGIPR
jgi:hypothetical protein